MQQQIYNNYISDCLWALSTGAMLDGEKWRPYAEQNKKKQTKKDTRTGRQIANNLLEDLKKL